MAYRRSALELDAERWLRVMSGDGRVPPFEVEHEWDRPRSRRRLDFAWPVQRVALQIEGAVFSGGKHGRGAGIHEDIVLGNDLALAGWTLYRADARIVSEGKVIGLMDRAFARWRHERDG